MQQQLVSVEGAVHGAAGAIQPWSEIVQIYFLVLQ